MSLAVQEKLTYIAYLPNYIKLLILNKTGSFLPTPDATGELSQPSGNSGRVRRNWSDSVLWLEESPISMR